MKNDITFDALVERIQTTDSALQNNARLVINRHVTAKAWLTGYYIVEYEQKGEDRAKYGERLLQTLAERLQNIKTFSYRSLRLYRQFYLTYQMLNEQVCAFLLDSAPIGQTVSAKLEGSDNQDITNWQTVSANLMKSKTSVSSIQTQPEKIFNRLSFSHLSLILPIKDHLKRTFYETMAIRGTWSVRELQRQIDANYYERSGWSEKPEKLAQLVDEKAEIATIDNDIKSPYVFEFLGLNAKDVWEESDLERAIIDHLQEFILELGMGFCFEARQYKMLIDNRYHRADLVFYHRILKRHIIIELKAHRLDYPDITQLNMYIGYFRKNVKLPEDNEPIGILMCTEVGQEMAEYATIGMDSNLLISKYELQLPSKERITEFLRKENEGLASRNNKE